MVAANTDIAKIIVGALEKPGTLNAIQNLSVLLMALSCIPPAEFYRLVFAIADGAARLAAHSRNGHAAPPSEDGEHPPGAVGHLPPLAR